MLAMVLSTIAACTHLTPLPPSDPTFQALADSQGDLQTRAWLRRHVANADRPLLVVIEGDGAAWQRNGTPPIDPTPRAGVGAKLAAALAIDHPVLYLARPCQYLPAAQLARCSIHHWTDRRFDEAPLAALNRLIDRASLTHEKLILIGYSGGGVLAAQLGLRRSDVILLLTVASPLNLGAWTRLHNISPLTTALSGTDLSSALARATFPQRHLFGSDDDVVPAGLGAGLPANSVRIVQGLGHDDDWVPAVKTALHAMPRQLNPVPNPATQ